MNRKTRKMSERRMARYGFNINPQFIDYYALDYVLKRNYTTNQEAVIDAIKYLYTFWPDKWSNQKVREQFVKMATDAYYLAPVSLSARLHSESGSMVFMYVNAYNFSTGALNPDENFLPSWMSVCHDCELYLLFGFPWMPKRFLPFHLRNVSWTDSDKSASKIFMSMIKKFAETKNPNLQHESTWVNYGPRDHYYLLFNGTYRTMGKSYEWERVAFWNYYIDQLASYMTTTFSPTVIAIRRELVYYRASLGIFSILSALLIVVAGTLAYFLFERGKRRRLLAAASVATDSLQSAFSFDSRTNFLPLVNYPSSTACGKK
uniref:Carboxylesterase type B domain-containing protein n=1 Tax=Romanomermis culicivorax TaxID=13658 RepID=A0A915KXJ7_ROMCU